MKTPVHERGIALVISLLALLTLSTLAAAIIFVIQAEILTAKNFKQLSQARYAAESGVQKAINYFVSPYTSPSSTAGYTMSTSPVQYGGQAVVLSATGAVASNYPVAAVQTAFNSALSNQSLSGMNATVTYAVYATVLRMRPATMAFGSSAVLETWQITSTGTVSGDRPAQVQVVEVVEKNSAPLFTYAAYATATSCGSITTGSSILSDSFDSSLGTYTATQQNNNGNIGTIGNFNKGSFNSTFYGSLSTPYGTATGASCGSPMNAAYGSGVLTVSGGLQTITAPALPTVTAPATPTTSYALPGTVAPGTYGNATGSGTTHFSAGTYNFNSICATSNITFVVDSGPVILNIGGNSPLGSRCSTSPASPLTFTKKLTINNGGVPANFQIVYAGSGTFAFQDVTIIYALMYFPNGRLSTQLTANFYGSTIAGTLNYQSATGIHYDRSLQNGLGTPGPYRPISFNWSKY